MDPNNRPAPFMRYRGAAVQELPTELPREGAPAVEVLAGQGRADAAPVDIRLLARLLYFSAGVTRVAGPEANRVYFRAAASAGNLHPVETYLLCGDLVGLDSGLYHFAPEAFALERLRAGDHRGFVADAAEDPALRKAPAVFVVTGIPWRTAWKYGERGWRHVYWDAGTMLANLLTVAEGYGIGMRVLFGFRDAALCRVLGIDGTTAFPVAAVVIEETAKGNEAAETVDETPAPELDELRMDATPLSAAPIEFPLTSASQHAGSLSTAEEVREWRAVSLAGLPATTRPAATTEPRWRADEPIENVILRRGSTRSMRRQEVPSDLLAWGMSCAARPAPIDAVPQQRTLLSHYLSVHSVESHRAGLYHRADHALVARPGRVSPDRARATAAHLCLDQILGGDSAYTLFVCADLNQILNNLGDRGYRVAQTEAGIAVGRLQLAAFALGYGATGLTFYDDEVATALGSDACMMVCSVGEPNYESIPGGPPGHPAELSPHR